MYDLEHIHTVETAVKSLVALVVRCGMQHLIVHQTVVVSVKHLSQ